MRPLLLVIACAMLNGCDTGWSDASNCAHYLSAEASEEQCQLLLAARREQDAGTGRIIDEIRRERWQDFDSLTRDRGRGF
ncbi:hypothetical protein JYK14_13870 [Siccirubricoccus sp. KC 17139]|uniref:Lipoprotein n=1 Tax=Siccirubricoccus soli TaxID=2899147 RepID=A0ABT1D5V0_9PROT|nr:hypothetical protein [Siccirubricoccus soli]MCO6417244.1 hypothetical protein [Siccirubricoccus soli]MCP2683379.1 hypothetical protein [Siccirubricoccus soli]